MPQSNNNDNITPHHCSVSRNDRIKKSKKHKSYKCLETLPNTYMKCHISQKETSTPSVKAKKPKKTRKTDLEENSQLIGLLDKVVYEWFQRAQRLIETGTITNEMFLQKAHEFKQIFGIPYLLTDYAWVWNFRKKYNITNLDMTMLRIDNDNRALLSVDMNDIIMDVLKSNSIPQYYTSYTSSLQSCDTSEGDHPSTTYTISDPTQNLIFGNNDKNINETILPDSLDETVGKLDPPPFPVIITDDEQARRYLKPLEDYVLLKENFRAIGLISQLEDIFQQNQSQNKVE
ncbi:uncharacterized protein LOC129947416 [Eupeodes corollae]|uniref:uncharacterized protein LOC129947416 n=1 Tax=Eupeodes corollae TaxID=290404 RepID=UPI002491B326|nr:uncharacterized protein LOC129947416 [Eupeodes corollae]